MRSIKLFGSFAAVAAVAVFIATSLIPGEVNSQGQSKPQGVINTLGSDGIAILGYDPVAYFTEGAPRKGKAEHAVMHKGAQWQFASAQNKALFEADPDKYTPSYGGYCAYGVSQGYLVKIEPDAWAIRDGKLYLNYDKSVQKTWSQKPADYIALADRQWPGLAPKN